MLATLMLVAPTADAADMVVLAVPVPTAAIVALSRSGLLPLVAPMVMTWPAARPATLATRRAVWPTTAGWEVLVAERTICVASGTAVTVFVPVGLIAEKVMTSPE